jgi:2,4-dienoyl-CoA reductase-like NADH-dependent reductase (Old Yellow Enzyme family)
VPEAYYRPYARAVKANLKLPVILVGGIRTTETMADVITSGDADFLAMARPLIREPDLPAKIAAGRRGLVDCVSCNLCLEHEGKHGLRCWRKSAGSLAYHAYCRCWRDRRGHGRLDAH